MFSCSGNPFKFLDQHLEIIRALMERNGERSKQLMNKHIKEARESLIA
jgi:DNA-binding GntR family transcriptional regulator